ncbi:MAG: hypothetical protein MMC33_004379 [Icmadophila ericetorum]|nr:hypothetical protein [Icmadophila ericetorum]
MLEDLRELSKTYESERMSSRRDPRSRPEGSPSQSTHVGDPNFGGAGTPYSESQTLQRRRDDPMYQHSPQYPQSELYSPNGSNGYGSTPGYGSSSASSYPSSESAYSSGTYGGSMISSSMSGQPNYATTGMPDPRYGTTNPSYTFGAPAENESYATYGQAYPTQPQYPPPPRTEMSGYYSSAADMRTVTAPVDPYTQDPYGPTYPRQTPVPGIGSQSVYPGSRPGPGPYDPNTYPTRPDQRNPYEQQPRRPHR